MCGIAGILVQYPPAIREYKNALGRTMQKMVEAIRHRGPDGEGQWMNGDGSVCLGHARLSIIDLTDAAAQPMHYTAIAALDDEIDRYTITYNGEIYNYLELKDTLTAHGYRFKTTSDTEVILAAYDYWKEDCLTHFDGMFAFSIWDAKQQILFAARDRFGEKPFYYYADERQFVFASEMKALWRIGVEKEVDQKMIANYLALGYVQNADDKKQTFYENIASLPPAHYLQLHLPTFTYHLYSYWRLEKDTILEISPEKAIAHFTELFQQSVTRRLRSDVTVGSSLSGGIDSSSIVANIAAQLAPKQQLPVFSAIFPGFAKDESAQIQLMAKQYPLQLHAVTPDADGLIAEFEKLCFHQEEPFPSSSIYAQYKVFELAKQQGVKVLLDGQGADETLAGYHKYIHWYIQQLVDRKKYSTAISERRAFNKAGYQFKWGLTNYLATYLPAHAAISLEQRDYMRLVRQPDFNRNFVKSLHGREWEGLHKPIITKLNDSLYFNTAVLGLEELLRFADRNSMAHGREVRLPFLSHELVEFLFLLPAHYKIHDAQTKWILRQAMSPLLPEAIVQRKEKVGFEPPQFNWMQQPRLQEYMQEAKRKMVNAGILNSNVLDKPVVPKHAHEAANYHWRYLCVAHLLK